MASPAEKKLIKNDYNFTSWLVTGPKTGDASSVYRELKVYYNDITTAMHTISNVSGLWTDETRLNSALEGSGIDLATYKSLRSRSFANGKKVFGDMDAFFKKQEKGEDAATELAALQATRSGL